MLLKKNRGYDLYFCPLNKLREVRSCWYVLSMDPLELEMDVRIPGSYAWNIKWC